MFLWLKSVHVRNHLVRLCPKIMGEGGALSTPLSIQYTQTNQQNSCSSIVNK